MRASKLYATQNKVIHMAFAALGLPYAENKDGWISLFREIARRKIKGLSDLTLSERRKVIAHLNRKGGLKLFNPQVAPAAADWKHGDRDMEIAVKRGFPGRPAIEAAGIDKMALLAKIEAHLAEAKRPWEYVHAMARHMFKIDRVQWLKAAQLSKIVAALEYDARRHRRYTGI